MAMSLLFLAACAITTTTPTVPEAPPSSAASEPTTELTLTRLSDGVWLHTSTRALEGYGPFPSHGLVIEHADGVLLVDTGWGMTATEVLLERIEQRLGRRPSAAIITDFHEDRAGGAAVLERAGIEVWTSEGIARRLHAEAESASFETFDGSHFAGTLGGVPLEVSHPGPGHSPENLVVWIPEHQLLFGGCLIRPWESRSLGNQADADLEAWGPSLRAVRDRYGTATTVVPSHGAPGGSALVDHSIALVDIATATRMLKAGDAVPPMRVAVTVDDMPRHGPLPPGVTRAQVHAKLLEAFERHHVPEVRGFVVGQHADASDDDRRALRSWVDAGHPLGNHTWSHPRVEKIGTEAYLADIDRNEAALIELTGDASGERWRSFRYPYLREGFDRESGERIRAHLDAGGYSIAEVSVDFWDWDYQQPYARCLKAGSESGVDALSRTYLDRAVHMLEWNRAAARMAFGRPVAHILLLHAGAFTAEMIEPMLAAYEARGVEWITMDEALSDPIYRDASSPAQTQGGVLIEQAAVTMGIEHPPWPRHPRALLNALCR